jgi:hypothetical protein
MAVSHRPGPADWSWKESELEAVELGAPHQCHPGVAKTADVQSWNFQWSVSHFGEKSRPEHVRGGKFIISKQKCNEFNIQSCGFD